jgi:hypothetical protein
MDFEILKDVAEWTGIGGVAICAITLIYRGIVGKNIFPKLRRDQAYRLLMTIVGASLILGLAGLATHAYIVYVQKAPDKSPANVTSNTTLDLSDRSHYEDRSNHDNRIIVTPPADATPQGSFAPRPTPGPVELRPQTTPPPRAVVPYKPPQVSQAPPARTDAPRLRQQEDEESTDGELAALYQRLHDLREEGYRIARNLPDDLGGRERQYQPWKEKVLSTLGRLDSHLRSQYRLDTHYEENFNDLANQLMDWDRFSMLPSWREQTASSFRSCAEYVDIYQTKAKTELMMSRM